MREQWRVGRRRGTLARRHVRASHAVEGQEQRALMYTYVTVSVAGALPLQVVSGSSVTADVRQLDSGAQVNADPTGTVSFVYFNTYGDAGRLLGTASNFTVITPSLDSQGTATLTLTPPFGDGLADSFGDDLILAVYGGGGNVPSGSSYMGGGNQVQSGDPTVRISPAEQYIPVDLVAPAATASLSVTRGPTDPAVGGTIDPPVQVSILTASGTVDTTSTASVTVPLASTSTGTGALGGTTTVAAVAGVATFSDLSVDKAGQYSLTCTDAAGNKAAPDPFQVQAEHLASDQLPTTVAAGRVTDPRVTVGARDAAGNPEPSATGSVTLSLDNASRLGTSNRVRQILRARLGSL